MYSLMYIRIKFFSIGFASSVPYLLRVANNSDSVNEGPLYKLTSVTLLSVSDSDDTELSANLKLSTVLSISVANFLYCKI